MPELGASGSVGEPSGNRRPYPEKRKEKGLTSFTGGLITKRSRTTCERCPERGTFRGGMMGQRGAAMKGGDERKSSECWSDGFSRAGRVELDHGFP
jgi:hypothetical protein